MPTLAVFVDYDNADRKLTNGGPASFASTVVHAIPSALTKRFDSIAVRLYGGWRSNGRLTQSAQKIVPEIRSKFPNVVLIADGQTTFKMRMLVDLAEAPIGLSAPLDGTLARDRTIRRFRANPNRLASCVNVLGCGMQAHFPLNERSPCSDAACPMELGDLLVRDEQKMVDTLIVADIAQEVFLGKATDIVVVSSDVDMWPGVMLALRNACNVLHIHPKGGSTQLHLLQTIVTHMSGQYTQGHI
jgi:hypothetical protein